MTDRSDVHDHGRGTKAVKAISMAKTAPEKSEKAASPEQSDRDLLGRIIRNPEELVFRDPLKKRTAASSTMTSSLCTEGGAAKKHKIVQRQEGTGQKSGEDKAKYSGRRIEDSTFVSGVTVAGHRADMVQEGMNQNKTGLANKEVGNSTGAAGKRMGRKQNQVGVGDKAAARLERAVNEQGQNRVDNAGAGKKRLDKDKDQHTPRLSQDLAAANYDCNEEEREALEVMEVMDTLDDLDMLHDLDMRSEYNLAGLGARNLWADNLTSPWSRSLGICNMLDDLDDSDTSDDLDMMSDFNNLAGLGALGTYKPPSKEMRRLEETKARMRFEETKARAELAEAKAQTGLAEAQGRLRLEEERAKMWQDEAQLRMSLVEARTKLCQDEAQARMRLDEAKERMRVAESRIDCNLAEAQARMRLAEARAKMWKEGAKSRMKLAKEKIRLSKSKVELARMQEKVEVLREYRDKKLVEKATHFMSNVE